MDRSERIGLGVSTAGHVVLFAALSAGLLHWSQSRPLTPPAIEVALADSVALEASATSHDAPQMAEAQELGPLEEDAAQQSAPDAALEAAPKAMPSPTPALPVEPEAVAPAIRTPTPPKAKAAPSNRDKGETAKETPRRARRLGDDFLKGLDSAQPNSKTTDAGGGTAPLSAAAVRALNAEIGRQVKPYWNPPAGVDVDQLVSVIAVSLAANGTIEGTPRVIAQSGVTASNASQKSLHAENAIRAVRLAAPFKLPPDLYDAWQSLEIRFDYRLSR